MDIYNLLYLNLKEYLKEPSVFVALMVGSGLIVMGRDHILFSKQTTQIEWSARGIQIIERQNSMTCTGLVTS
jgi:hypothetical protein